MARLRDDSFSLVMAKLCEVKSGIGKVGRRGVVFRTVQVWRCFVQSCNGEVSVGQGKVLCCFVSVRQSRVHSRIGKVMSRHVGCW